MGCFADPVKSGCHGLLSHISSGNDGKETN